MIITDDAFLESFAQGRRILSTVDNAEHYVSMDQFCKGVL